VRELEAEVIVFVVIDTATASADYLSTYDGDTANLLNVHIREDGHGRTEEMVY